MTLWMALAGRLLVATGRLRRADVVFVLSGDTKGDRLMKATEVLQRSEARRIVVFVTSVGPIYDPRPAATAYLRSRGVPLAWIRMIGPSANTSEEAGWAVGLARRCGWSRIAVVTSRYHTRRAGWLFRRAFKGAEVDVIASDAPFHSGQWWTRPGDRDHVLGEWAKGLATFRYLFVRPSARDPGAAC